MYDIATICQKAQPVLRAVGKFLREEQNKVTAAHIEVKSRNSLVSYVDKEAEQRLIEGLQPLLPEAVFYTEEEIVARKRGEWRWIIDPLDGTTNFLHGLPCYAISIALQHKDELVLGMVLEAARDELFYAWNGGGAWCNGQPIQVTAKNSLADSLLATGFPYYDYDRWPAYQKVLEHLIHHTRGIRRFGAAAVDLAYVACGRFDGFFEYSLHAWDVAGGIVLVREAGGQVSDFSGQSNYLFGQEILVSGQKLHAELLPLFQTAFSSKDQPI